MRVLMPGSLWSATWAMASVPSSPTGTVAGTAAWSLRRVWDAGIRELPALNAHEWAVLHALASEGYRFGGVHERVCTGLGYRDLDPLAAAALRSWASRVITMPDAAASSRQEAAPAELHAITLVTLR
jgi:hypothetical protein